MKVRLAVSLEDSDFIEVGRAARSKGLSVAEWVRLAVFAELAAEAKVQAKVSAVRKAATHSVPTCDIDQMLDEIASGRR